MDLPGWQRFRTRVRLPPPPPAFALCERATARRAN